MNRSIIYEDLGLLDYGLALQKQREIFDPMVVKKFSNLSLSQDKQLEICSHLLFVEHPHVYTLGKSGDPGNLLINNDFLQSIGATYYQVDRGGDITYHGPGQIVGYPIFDLEPFGMRIRQYVWALEESVILTLSHFSIEAGRLAGATGVWIDHTGPLPRKICAIGVRARRQITMHGFAFNVNTNLDYFRYINPCGFIDKGVTSMQKELGREQDFPEVKSILREKLISFFTNF